MRRIHCSASRFTRFTRCSAATYRSPGRRRLASHNCAQVQTCHARHRMSMHSVDPIFETRSFRRCLSALSIHQPWNQALHNTNLPGPCPMLRRRTHTRSARAAPTPDHVPRATAWPGQLPKGADLKSPRAATPRTRSRHGRALLHILARASHARRRCLPLTLTRARPTHAWRSVLSFSAPRRRQLRPAPASQTSAPRPGPAAAAAAPPPPRRSQRRARTRYRAALAATGAALTHRP
jgi:hypothetical protein